MEFEPRTFESKSGKLTIKILPVIQNIFVAKYERYNEFMDFFIFKSKPSLFQGLMSRIIFSVVQLHFAEMKPSDWSKLVI